MIQLPPECITGIVTCCSAFISSFITWFLTRKKYHTEVDAQLTSNMQQSLDFYIRYGDDTQKRLDTLIEEKRVLQGQIESLQDKVNIMQEQNAFLVNQNIELKKEIAELKETLTQLLPKKKGKNKNS